MPFYVELSTTSIPSNNMDDDFRFSASTVFPTTIGPAISDCVCFSRHKRLYITNFIAQSLRWALVLATSYRTMYSEGKVVYG